MYLYNLLDHILFIEPLTLACKIFASISCETLPRATAAFTASLALAKALFGSFALR